MRTFEPKSISDEIESLARLTGAPEPFIAQVKALFEKKGISLRADSSPYTKALEEAFRREENIRATSERARRNVVTNGRNFTKIGQAYVKQAERLREDNSEVLARTKRILGGGKASGSAQRAQSVTIQGDHRSFVTRAQRDDLPMVPGPRDVQ